MVEVFEGDKAKKDRLVRSFFCLAYNKAPYKRPSVLNDVLPFLLTTMWSCS